MNANKFKIFVGYDSREDAAYRVCKYSLESTTKFPGDVEVIPLKLDELIEQGHYERDIDPLASTEFTFSRFLVPHLMDFDGWALFCDCDFLFKEGVEHLFEAADDQYAVMCVQHDYKPKDTVKMDGKLQHIYPRKNWSSLVLWNCGHPSNKEVTKELVNNPDTTGQYLHRFTWLDDHEIGRLELGWNWLVGWYREPQDGRPKAIHYTEGGPWFKRYQLCEYAADWLVAEKDMLKSKRKEQKAYPVPDTLEGFDDEKFALLEATLHASIDPEGLFYNETIETIRERVEKMGNKVAAIDSEGGINYKDQGHAYDPLLVDFVHGSRGTLSNWDREKETDNALVIRGLGGGSRKAIHHCMNTGRDFYAIDTGYYGNIKAKRVHRVTKNGLQHYGPIIERPGDRSRKFGYKFKKFTPGSKILVCPPSLKVMELFGQPDPETWVEQITQEIKKYTDRPIEIRLKPNRTDRITTKSIQAALADNVHCLITYNSIAAVEAMMEGKPAIVLGPNAAQSICSTDLRMIETPNKPTKEEMDAFMAHLGYCQFTVDELRNGYAWRIVNEQHEQD